MTTSDCCAHLVPNVGTAKKLTSKAPRIAPTVFDAYTKPLERPGSPPARFTAASASGKLMPQSTADGKITSIARSTCMPWSACTGVDEPGDAQGKTRESKKAANKIAGTSKS